MSKSECKHVPKSMKEGWDKLLSLRESKPAGMTWRDYVVMLLHIGAEIEHALLVEYLYAAYSLGGDQIPEQHRPRVARWQRLILCIAREEMGHLATVQNVLTLLGAPLSLDRQDYPFDSPYIAFPFRLEPLTHASLARYVYVEMPDPDDPCVRQMFPDTWEKVRCELQGIREEVEKAYPDMPLHHVSKIYDAILEIIKDPERIPDSAFRAETVQHQASFADWGRNYKSPSRRLDAEGTLDGKQPMPTPEVLVLRMATRTDAIDALEKVAGQGEAPKLTYKEWHAEAESGTATEPSHFAHFYQIWKAWGRHVDGWSPSRDVAIDPTTVPPSPGDPRHGYIRDDRSRTWAHLLNLRYRMLLAYLAHALRLARTVSPTEPSARAPTMHRVYTEMYNLKAISGILMQLPFGGDEGDPQFAGPPFEQPYSLDVPDREGDAWRLHRELVVSAGELCKQLLPDAPPAGVRYLRALMDVDAQTMTWLDKLIRGTDR